MSTEGAGDLMNAVLKEQCCSNCGKPLMVLGWAQDEFGPHVQSVCGACHPELIPTIEYIGPSGQDAERLAINGFLDEQMRRIAEAFSPSPRVITRVMDDGVQTKDGAA